MADQSASPFFKLPPELRNAIYLMLFEGCILEVDGFERAQPPRVTSLLLTAKQTYNEAVQIYYNNVIVQSSTIAGLVNWTKRRQGGEFYHLITELSMTSVVIHRASDERAKMNADILASYTLECLENEDPSIRNKRFSVEMKYSRSSYLSASSKPMDGSAAITLMHRIS